MAFLCQDKNIAASSTTSIETVFQRNTATTGKPIMDAIRRYISSSRNTTGGIFHPGDLARYQPPGSFVVAPVPPTPMWPVRRIPRALPANDPIAVA